MKDFPTDLHLLSAVQLVQHLEHKTLTSVQITQYFLERITRYNPTLKAVLALVPDALEHAKRCDLERAAGQVRSALHGIPVLIKDNIDLLGMPTTVGSRVLEGNFPARDAFLIERLREAGLILLGKTNLTEFANFVTLDMPNGYSSQGGQVQNPHGKGLDVGGSSSGSAAAIAAGFAPLAVGTETSGSILHPANQNGIVGIKPTVGAVSRRGIVPISGSQDTAGPLASTVQDCALLLEVLSASDPEDAVTSSLPPLFKPTPQTHTTLEGIRLGVPRAGFWDTFNPVQLEHFETQLENLKTLGATLQDPLDFPDAPALERLGFDVLIYEFKPALEQYLADSLPEIPKTLQAILERYQNDLELCYPYGTVLLQASQATKGDLSEKAYLHTRSMDLKVAQGGLKGLLERCDALVFPSFLGYGVAAKAGFPSVTVPTGKLEGKMEGIMFTGADFSEALLVGIAHAFEQKTQSLERPDLTI